MAIPHFPLLFAKAAIEAASEVRAPSGFIGASALGPKSKVCLRKFQYTVLKTPRNKTNPELPMAISLTRGTITHDMVTGLAERIDEVDLEANTLYVLKDLLQRGELDFEFELPEEDGGRTVLELKTIDPDIYHAARLPLIRHVYQVHSYMMGRGAKQAIIYYIPHLDKPQDDLVTLLRKAERRAGGEILNVIQQAIALTGHARPMRPQAPKELGSQFLVDFDEVIAQDIRGQMAEVEKANEERIFLPKNLDNCTLCPYTLPCMKGETFGNCDRREP